MGSPRMTSSKQLAVKWLENHFGRFDYDARRVQTHQQSAAFLIDVLKRSANDGDRIHTESIVGQHIKRVRKVSRYYVDEWIIVDLRPAGKNVRIVFTRGGHA